MVVQSNSFELGLLSRGRSKSDSMDDKKITPSHEPKHGACVQSLGLLASCNFGPEADALAKKVVDELSALRHALVPEYTTCIFSIFFPLCFVGRRHIWFSVCTSSLEHSEEEFP